MKNELMSFEGHNVEVIEVNGKVLFNPYHVAEILDIKNVRDNISKMNEKQVVKLTNSIVGETDFRKLHNTGENFLTESGVYKLIFKSHKENAERFQDWVFDEVLPSIRKHGMYATDELLANPDFAIQVFQELKAEREARKQLQTTIAVQSQKIAELQPKASYYDVILNCKDLVSATQIAKDYGKSAKWLNEFLHNHGVQFKQSGIWILYQDYASQGYTNTKTHEYNGSDGSIHAKVHTYWTQKGRLFIYDLLKEHGYLPNCEREEVA